MMKIYCSNLSFILVARTKYVKAQRQATDQAVGASCQHCRWGSPQLQVLTHGTSTAFHTLFHENTATWVFEPGCVPAQWGGFLTGSHQSGYCEVECKVEQEAGEVWEVQLYEGIIWHACSTVWGCCSSRRAELADSQQAGTAVVLTSSLSCAPTTQSASQGC